MAYAPPARPTSAVDDMFEARSARPITGHCVARDARKKSTGAKCLRDSRSPSTTRPPTQTATTVQSSTLNSPEAEPVIAASRSPDHGFDRGTPVTALTFL